MKHEGKEAGLFLTLAYKQLVTLCTVGMLRVIIGMGW